MRCPWFVAHAQDNNSRMHSTAFIFISFSPPSGIRRQCSTNKTSPNLPATAIVHRFSLFHSLVFPSHYPSTSFVVFLCFLFPPLARIALLPVVYCSSSLLRSRTTSAFFS